MIPNKEAFGDSEVEGKTPAEQVSEHFAKNGPGEVDVELEREKAEVLADYAMWDAQEKEAAKGKATLKTRMDKLFMKQAGMYAHGAHMLDITPVKGRTTAEWEKWARDMFELSDGTAPEVDKFLSEIAQVKAGNLDHQFVTKKSDGVKYSVKEVKR